MKKAPVSRGSLKQLAERVAASAIIHDLPCRISRAETSAAPRFSLFHTASPYSIPMHQLMLGQMLG